MQREFSVYHAWLHVKCIGRILKEYVFQRKHRGRLNWYVAFYSKGILRSIGMK